MILSQQHQHIILTSYTNNITITHQHYLISHTSFRNTWNSFNNIIISSSLHIQTQDTHSTASSLTLLNMPTIYSKKWLYHPHVIHKHMTLSQQLHHIILTSYTNTWDTHSTASSLTLLNMPTIYSKKWLYHPHVIHKHMILSQQQHHRIILALYANRWLSLINFITSS